MFIGRNSRMWVWDSVLDSCAKISIFSHGCLSAQNRYFQSSSTDVFRSPFSKMTLEPVFLVEDIEQL